MVLELNLPQFGTTTRVRQSFSIWATPPLEIFDETQAETIDQIETGQRISGQIRFALQVPDLKAAMERLLAHGAIMVHPPIITPWGDYNVRFQDPDGMQITLFQKLDKEK